MSIFADLYASQYDNLYGTKDYASECALIESAQSRHGGRPASTILDIGCGTGGHAIELARRGYKTTGVDLSKAMLDQAKKKVASEYMANAPHWMQGDARTFDAGQKFDLAIMMFAVIGYLTTNDDVLSALRNIRRHLNPGALFVCDFWYGPTVLTVRPGDRLRSLEQGELRTLRAATTTVDSVANTADVQFQLWTLAGDRLVGEAVETHRMRYFFAQEMSLFLSSSGFEALSLSEFPTLDNPLTDDSWNAFSIARAM